MKIWCISDTHCQHRGLEVPDVDVVVHCGDEANSRNTLENVVEHNDFALWWSEIGVRKIFVPGNHSLSIANGWYCGLTPLINSSVTIGGVKFFGSPYTPSWGHSWAYMVKRHNMHHIWQLIPEDTDILITHGPPKGILDVTRDRDSGHLIQVGCTALRRRVEQLKPKIHMFGHIHDEKGVANAGVFERNGTKFINCSVCDNRGNLINNGVVIDV